MISILALTKQQGAEITAIFWGCFAAMRFISIFAAIYLKPIYIMVVSCVVSCFASFILVIDVFQSLFMLQICSAFLGFGMASIYATGKLLVDNNLYSEYY